MGKFIVIFCIFAFGNALPNINYGGKTHQEFITDALKRSTPGNARILAELFGGLELGLELGHNGAQAIISVGGAATRCQHQSPCFDTQCQLCYDPLLRIHGRCGGASYFTCRGTLPKGCLPFSCTSRNGRSMIPEDLENAVFVKKFPRFEDPFCLGRTERARSLASRKFKSGGIKAKDMTQLLNSTFLSSLSYHPRDIESTSDNSDVKEPTWVLPVPDAITPCQSYDLCLDMGCGRCYDPYLGAHTTCGKMTYYNCKEHLPEECMPLKCTETNIKELFPMAKNETMKSDDNDLEEGTLMVRSFKPLKDQKRHCI